MTNLETVTLSAVAALWLAAAPAFAHNGDYSLSDFPNRTFVCEQSIQPTFSNLRPAAGPRITVDVDTSISLLQVINSGDRRYPIIDDTVVYQLQTDEFGLAPHLVADLWVLDLGDNGKFQRDESGRWWFQEGKYMGIERCGGGSSGGHCIDAIVSKYKATYICLAPSSTWTR